MPALPRPAMHGPLGMAICDRDPYKNQMELEDNWAVEIEEDTYEVGFWNFKGRNLRIKKAIRIPYTYVDALGNRVKEYLLIGYEGSGGD